MGGVKIIFKSSTGMVLAFRDADGWNLPSAPARSADELREATRTLFKRVTGSFPEEDLIPAYRGYDEEFGMSSSYVLNWDGTPRVEMGRKAERVGLAEILCGKWGLFARDAFHNLRMINRPKLDLEELYRISSKALSEGSAHATVGADKALDEIVFLIDIGKLEAVGDLLRSTDVHRMHADILSAMMVAIDKEDVPWKHAFIEEAGHRIGQIDRHLRKFVLKDESGRILSSDVRKDALRHYRKKADEFGKKLRAGELGDGLHRGGRPISQRKSN